MIHSEYKSSHKKFTLHWKRTQIEDGIHVIFVINLLLIYRDIRRSLVIISCACVMHVRNLPPIRKLWKAVILQYMMRKVYTPVGCVINHFLSPHFCRVISANVFRIIHTVVSFIIVNSMNRATWKSINSSKSIHMLVISVLEHLIG